MLKCEESILSFRRKNVTCMELNSTTNKTLTHLLCSTFDPVAARLFRPLAGANGFSTETRKPFLELQELNH